MTLDNVAPSVTVILQHSTYHEMAPCFRPAHSATASEWPWVSVEKNPADLPDDIRNWIRDRTNAWLGHDDLLTGWIIVFCPSGISDETRTEIYTTLGRMHNLVIENLRTRESQVSRIIRSGVRSQFKHLVCLSPSEPAEFGYTSCALLRLSMNAIVALDDAIREPDGMHPVN